jgi:nucleotide-binding universal stress UspA family protein
MGSLLEANDVGHRYRTILCPIDLSPVSGPAIDLAYGVAAPDAVVHLLHVVGPVAMVSPLDGTYLAYGNDPAEQIAKEERAEKEIRKLVPDDAAANGVRTEVDVVNDVGVAEQVLAKAKAVHADVIVMGTHGRGGLGRLVLGSVANDVLRRAALRVILVHDGKPA